MEIILFNRLFGLLSRFCLLGRQVADIINLFYIRFEDNTRKKAINRINGRCEFSHNVTRIKIWSFRMNHYCTNTKNIIRNHIMNFWKIFRQRFMRLNIPCGFQKIFGVKIHLCLSSKIRHTIPLFLLVFFFLPVICYSQQIYSSILWQRGKGKYKNYRIPSLIVAPNGTILAFCEGREGGDSGDIDVLMRRSTDNGRTWSEESVVWNDKNNTCGNPCPAVDKVSGRIWLLLTWNLGQDVEKEIILKKSKDTRRPFICYSDDFGKTWSKPLELSKTCKDPTWGWYATGPGIGIQLKSKKYKNRLVIPANHSYNDPDGNLEGGPYGYGAHVLISDDFGKNWRKSDPIRPGCSESQLVELSNGSLLMNIRSYNDKFCRASAISHDGGDTWSNIQHETQLVESTCQASFIRYGDYLGNDMFLFANPAVPIKRSHMTIKISFDDCLSWSNSKLIHAGPAAYSALTVLPYGKIGIFYECGEKSAYTKMLFTAFPVEKLFAEGVMPETE